MREIIEALRDHAALHYDTGGWDVLVECYSDDEIAAELAAEGITTLPNALVFYRGLLGRHDEARADIEGEAF